MPTQDDVRENARNNVRMKQAFDAWMRMPLTRMAISMVPAGERQEALSALLESAFETGFSVGGGVMLCDMLEQIKPRGR